jgi:NADH:flavin oxidoreductase / NADH oxidase family
MTIGRMLVQNRIMMPGMSAGMMLDSDAQPTPEMIAYYVERAKTRPGLMAIGASAVVPAAAPRKMPLALDHDRHIPSLKKLVDAVHQYDTKFGIQLFDGGVQTGDRVQLSPSGGKVRRFKDVRNIVIGTDDSVCVVTDEGSEILPGIDTVVFASERRSNRSVAEFAKARGLETYIVGDASDVVSEDSGTIFSNIAQAYDIARRI